MRWLSWMLLSLMLVGCDDTEATQRRNAEREQERRRQAWRAEVARNFNIQSPCSPAISIRVWVPVPVPDDYTLTVEADGKRATCKATKERTTCDPAYGLPQARVLLDDERKISYVVVEGEYRHARVRVFDDRRAYVDEEVFPQYQAGDRGCAVARVIRNGPIVKEPAKLDCFTIRIARFSCKGL